MVSAQCVRKNLFGCTGKCETVYLKDRYNSEFPVKCCCIPWGKIDPTKAKYCYNIIYNSIPYGLTGEKERVEKVKERITDALEKTLSVDYDKNRLEQELIYYIEKLDVNEEKQRLSNHLKYFISTMESGNGQGKKLGFIAQEMGREINTLGSKSNHAEMQKIVVQMKDELEQIKEQVLNVM